MTTTAATSRPAVSVIMPTYNRRALLGEAIGSVLAQTFPDLELIVVDDGSTDGTPELLRQVSDPRVRVVSHLTNRGISAAANSGIRAARGDLIARLDSDDVWLPDMLAVLTAALHKHPEAGLAYASAVDYGGSGEKRGRPLRFPDDAFASMLCEDVTCNISLVARRECFERAGLFDETLRTSEDWDLWLRMARHVPFVFVDHVVARYRYHADNITGLSSPHARDMIHDRIHVLDKAFAQPDDAPLGALAVRALAYRNVLLDVGIKTLAHGDTLGALRLFRRAYRTGAERVVTLARIAWLLSRVLLLHRLPNGRAFADRLIMRLRQLGWLARGEAPARSNSPRPHPEVIPNAAGKTPQPIGVSAHARELLASPHAAKGPT